MTSFIDGPAKGQTLMLKRAARFIRVVVKQQDGKPKWDALDQPDDEPDDDETIYAYEIVDKPSMCHIHAGGGRGGFYPVACYRLVENQPIGAAMRDAGQWGLWCKDQAESHPREDLK